MAPANPVLDEIERWQSIYDWFNSMGEAWITERDKVEGFIRHFIASTNIATQETKQ